MTTVFIQENDRNVIPRWRSFDATQNLIELHSSLPPPQAPPTIAGDSLTRKLVDWESHQTIGHASDLIGTAYAQDELGKAVDAIEFLLDDRTKAAPLAKKLALRSWEVLNGIESVVPPPLGQQELRIQVSKLKKLLHEEPKNTFQWVDLSLAYASLGQYEQSSRCMHLAINLTPNNRFVLRSAARLWVHTDQKQRAYSVLVRSDRTRHDPWLMAAEIAVGLAAEKSPKFARRAKDILKKNVFLSSHISELASAVATLEWKNGAERNSRKLFRQSLSEPTENSIAQAVWMSEKESFLEVRNCHLLRGDAHEAKARNFFYSEMWDKAIQQCKKWQQIEPFSTRPAKLGSYIASVVLEDFQEALAMAEVALIANPNDPLLRNSSAYSLINLGRLSDAEMELSKMSAARGTEPSVVKEATKGLLRYRQNKTQEGQQLYDKAHLEARRFTGTNPALHAKVLAFHALERFRHQESPNRHEFISEAVRHLKIHKDLSSRVLLRKLNALLK